LATKGICSFDSADFVVTAGYVQIAGSFGGVQSILTDSGAPAVVPNVGGVVNILHGAGIAVTGQGPGNTVTIATTGVVATQYTAEDTTTCAPAAGNLNIIGTATNGINTTAGGSTMTVSMASPFSDSDFSFENNAVGVPRYVRSKNNDIDPGSYAALGMSARPAGGDAFAFFEIDGATRYYSMGIDNSVANDPFMFTSTVSPSGGGNIFMADVSTNTFTHYYGNILQSRAYVANGVNTIIQNTDNTNNASDAFLRLDVGGAAAGDPFIAFLVTGAGKYAMGPDNSDFDYFKITDGNTPSDGTTFALLNPTIYQWQYPVWEIQQQLTRIGAPIWHQIYNLDNTNGASQAYMQIETGGASSGDPFVNFLVNGLGTFSVGIDNSDSDKFKITSGANPSAGTDLFTMTNAGVITLANDLDVSEGGTGVSTLTSHGILMGNAAGDIQATAEPTDGQLLIGKTGNFPVLGSITSLAGTITVTPGAGTINIEAVAPAATTYTAEDATTCTPAANILIITGTATNGISTTAAGNTMTIGMASPYSDGDFTFTTATAAADRTVTISNTDNTAVYSAAHLQVTVGGAVSTGDPYTNYLVSGAGTYSVGIDNTVAGDPFKITSGANPSAGTDLFTMTSAGVITLNNDLDVTEGGTGVSTLTSHGILMGNGAGDIQATAEPSNGQLLIGKTGDFPQLAQLMPGMGISISSGAGSITVSAWGGGVSWTVETVDLNFTANKGIIANKAGLLTVTLPATGAIGDILEITGINTAVGWRIAQNANQQIYFGTQSTTVGVGGYIESLNIHDAIKLVCVVSGASTRWQVLSSIGNMTIV